MNGTNMRCLVVVQARMSSSRLPGKVLLPLGAHSIVEILLQRLSRSKEADGVIVATSHEASDDPVAEVAMRSGVKVVRGPLKNVYERFCSALRTYPMNICARVCADSPFYDARILDEGIRMYRQHRPFMVSTSVPRTFPAGQSVEVFDPVRFQEASAQVSSVEDQEHVTRYFYAHATKYPIFSLVNSEGDYSAHTHAVDTREDYERALRVARDLGDRIIDARWHEVDRLMYGSEAVVS